MRRLLLAVLLVAAVQQPVAGVVFVLDGVLIGAGDQNYLALAGLAASAVFAAAALWVHAAGGGLVALWLASASGCCQVRDARAPGAGYCLAGHRGRPPLTLRRPHACLMPFYRADASLRRGVGQSSPAAR